MNKINVILCYHYFQLCDLYENDSIFDKFECCLSGDGLRVATGSYGYFFHPLLTACVILQKSCLLTLPFPGVFNCSNIFRVFGCTPGSMEATTLEASRNPMRYILHVPFNFSHNFFTVVPWPWFGLPMHYWGQGHNSIYLINCVRSLMFISS